jgi:hypothetical protein
MVSLCSPAEAAGILNVSPEELAAWAEAGRVEQVLRGSGEAQYVVEELSRLDVGVLRDELERQEAEVFQQTMEIEVRERHELAETERVQAQRYALTRRRHRRAAVTATLIAAAAVFLLGGSALFSVAMTLTVAALLALTGLMFPFGDTAYKERSNLVKTLHAAMWLPAFLSLFIGALHVGSHADNRSETRVLEQSKARVRAVAEHRTLQGNRTVLMETCGPAMGLAFDRAIERSIDWALLGVERRSDYDQRYYIEERVVERMNGFYEGVLASCPR